MMSSQRLQRLKSLNRHCYDLGQCLHEAAPDLMSHVNEWLSIAACLKGVEFDIFRFDESVGYCSNADEYLFARQQILTQHVARLTEFTFVWGALEALIEILPIPPHPDKSRRGKINNACHYLSNGFHRRLSISPYQDLVGRFTELVSKSPSYKLIAEELGIPAHIGPEGAGLFMVYKLRNELAHGAMVFPYPDQEHRPISVDPAVVEFATRIVLLSIQMLVLAGYSNKGIVVEVSSEFDTTEVMLEDCLRILHFRQEDAPEDGTLLIDDH